MNTIKFSFLLLLGATFLFSSCKKEEDQTDNPTTGNLEYNFTGLSDLGPDYQYEGWLIVDGNAVSAGTFTVDAMGVQSSTSFEMDLDDLNGASTYVLTIEPMPDSDPSPSSTHILAGDFSGNSASTTVDHAAALGSDFTAAMGTYILATPTDGGSMDNESSGVWWLDPMAGPGASLSLPSLPAGWTYEGWAVIGGMPLSTGTFDAVDMADNASTYSGMTAGPAFPGEDFLMNAPSGLTFPTTLEGGAVVISIEPVPDNSPDPFLLKPLVGMVPAMAATHTSLMMDNNATATNPMGTVSK